MTTVLHILHQLSSGGGSRAVIHVAGESARQSPVFCHRLVSLIPANPQTLKLAQSAGLTVLNALSDEALWAEIAAADVVHVHFWNTPELYQVLSSDLPPCRMVVWIHIAGDGAPQVIIPELIEYADFVVACSPYTARHPAFQLPSADQKTTMILAGCDPHRLSGFSRRPQSIFTVGYIGMVDFIKMHPDFVRLHDEINLPEIKIVIVGTGASIKRVQSQVQQARHPERFVLLGQIEDVKSVFEQLDVFGYPLCPDNYAAAELVLQEAMLVGVPPVIFPFGGARDLVLNGQTGLIVESEAHYPKAIERLARDVELRQRLGENAQRYARQFFGADKTATQFNRLYEHLMERPKRERPSLDTLIERHQPALWCGLKAQFPGAISFLSSLGDTAPAFQTSFLSLDVNEQLAAESEIATSSPILCNANGGGIWHYRAYFPTDGYLRLWSGLTLEKNGRVALAVAEFTKAWELGCHHWRVQWYLARAATRAGANELAEKALQVAMKNAPDFFERMKNEK
ncbi:MAG: glycosyltransferase [Acidobacteria bacterium]|nr:glycosyltransferase [Acidobacteriota bacterium]